MGYKTKSMIKQLSGLSAEYYLDKELNKYTNKISDKPKKGESIAKSSKKFTPFEILKSKGSAIKRDEKQQIRKAGREAARNTDVDFVKATPMGGDYFSLMAATAENLASRGAGKRKARKAAKDLKRKDLREVKPIESEGVKKIQSTSPIPSASKEEIRVPKKTDRFKTLPTTPDDTSLVPKIKEKVNKSEPVKDYLTNYGPPPPPSSNQDLNENFRRKIYDVIVKTGEDARRILTPEAGREMEQKQRDMLTVGKSRDEINRVAQKFKKDRAFAEKLIRTGTNNPLSVEKANVTDFDAKLQESKNKKKEEGEAAKKRAIEEAQERLGGVQMLGDGFNKGMSRKNKYKK